jgi:phosphatidylserine decarboxylase
MFRIHPAGIPFAIGFTVVAALLWWLTPWLGMPAAIITLWCVWFFRDPDRDTPALPGVVYSGADGRVVSIGQAAPPPELGMGDTPLPRVSVFLNIFDVHVNRIPMAGAVTDLKYHPGQFINASFDKASDLNERQSVRLRTADGHDLVVVQIAGLIARRIICALRLDQAVNTGERYGLIRFGSRTDVYLPEGSTILVKIGDYATGGETAIARLPGSNAPADLSTENTEGTAP